MKIRKIIAMLCIAVTSTFVAAAQSFADTTSIKLDIHFRRAYSTYESNYNDNGKRMDQFVKLIEECLRDSSSMIQSIKIVGSASPEGTILLNKRLSANRAATIKARLAERIPSILPLITTESIIEDWEGLEEYLKTHEVANRDQLLAIIADTPETTLDAKGKTIEIRKQKLSALNNGADWQHIIDDIFPSLRSCSITAQVVMMHSVPEEETPQEEVTLVEEVEPLPVVTTIVAAKAECAAGWMVLDGITRYVADTLTTAIVAPIDTLCCSDTLYTEKIIAALKTNMLYDAATIINYSVEVPFSLGSQGFSLTLEHYTPWWLSRDNRRCMEYLSVGGELRWWFLSDYTLHGHYIGAYAYSGKGDIQWDLKGRYQFEHASTGLSYGYSMPLGKNFNLEFSLSMGWMRIPYRHYIPTDDWQILIADHSKEGVMKYIGPTRAAITLTMPIAIKYRQR